MALCLIIILLFSFVKVNNLQINFHCNCIEIGKTETVFFYICVRVL